MFVLFNSKHKSYLSSSGYYGNEVNIKGFATKEAAEKHRDTYYSGNNFTIKKMKVYP
jgi:hypothetical protein